MLTLPDILEIENDPELLSFRCPETGWPAWPAIRHDFTGHLIHELAYRWPALDLPVLTPLQRIGAVASLMRCLSHNARARSRGIDERPIMIFALGASFVPWNGKPLNRVNDHFALAAAGDTVMFEDVLYPRYEVPRSRANPNVLYTLPYFFARYASGLRTSASVTAVARRCTQYLAERTARLFGLELPPARRALIERRLTVALARYPFERRHYTNLYSRAKRRLIFIEEACYGHLAPQILAARELGIPVAEFQHAFITRGYRDYNFAPALLQSVEYRKVLPDYFLSYGRWWHDRFNAPVEKIIIGNPHRAESLTRRERATGARADVLVLAKAADVGRYLQLARDLDNAARGTLKIVFRAKSMDLSTVLDEKVERIGNVIIDRNPDFYTTLGAVDAVVSGPSTVLLEAVGIARRIFLWDDAAGRFQYPDDIFERFADAADLQEKLQSSAAPHAALPAEDDVWAPDWRSRYQAFLGRHLRR